MNQKKIALIGNPNSGKTTLYNRLTGLSAREGNYSGITINTEDGFWRSSSEGFRFQIIQVLIVYTLIKMMFLMMITNPFLKKNMMSLSMLSMHYPLNDIYI